MKLWQKDSVTATAVETFTVGNDRAMDLYLAPFDVLGSLAHVKMLGAVGLLNKADGAALETGLKEIYTQVKAGDFVLDEGVEDIHSQVEWMLTRQLGDVGKMIHTGRSRNDQVLLDMKLFLRSETEKLTVTVKSLFDLLQTQSERYAHDLLPGYTHFQLAMPSSFGLWLGAYAESLADDVLILQAAYALINKNPLGSGAGFGSSFPLDRSMTTALLGFEAMHYNVVYAQMTRGKTERVVAAALANIAATLSKLSSDACLYMSQDLGFISFPDELTTGSSIMPHKKNPDVFELIRAKCNRLQALPNDLALLMTNLPSGYHRDLQLIKEYIIPAFGQLQDCLHMMMLMMRNLQVRENILAADKYRYLFTVEAVNQLVLQGMPFRDAYRQIGAAVEAGTFTHDTNLQHTHEGSMGNLCNQEIAAAMQKALDGFAFGKVQEALEKLLS
jgi:argininosuccinate lyase